ncbi:MAG TPA: GNAT family N-acetyltransferase [Rhizomicrobium sp.]|jgi:GNAT superfamily N-acetyltransferase|nr:GNAT family N-acetyltransferase [Rhizomicrobium sp.]
MTGSKPRRLPTVVTFLEMKTRPSAIPPPQPKGKIALLRALNPPVHFYRYLYDAIGRDYHWVDRKRLSDAQLKAVLAEDRNEIYVLYAEGCPAGMAELDFRDATSANISYFGLIPEYVGRRLSYFFLYHTAMNAWAKPISKLMVNTCTLDHPRALPLYQRLGFAPYSREERFIDLL